MGIYRFVTTFEVDVAPTRLFEGLLRADAWWWASPHVRRFEVLAPGRPHDAVGARYEVTLAAERPPYRVALDVDVVDADAPHHLEVAVRGHLHGAGRWELVALAENSQVTWTWEVAPTRTWMSVLGAIARPVFVHNHHRVMRAGIEALVASVGGQLVGYQTSERSLRA